MADGMLVTGKTYNLTMRNLEVGRIALIGWQSECKRGRKYSKRGGPPHYAALRKIPLIEYYKHNLRKRLVFIRLKIC